MNSTIEKQNVKLIFAQNISKLMKDKNKTRRDVCRDLNLKYTTFCDWVNGRTLPRAGQLEKLGSYFGIEVGQLYIDIDRNDEVSERNRLDSYISGLRRLEMSVLDHMTDEQIKELIRSGYTFKHKTLEEYISEAGGKLVVSDELDAGEPVGDEIW